LTGQYLSGRKQVEVPQRRPVDVAEEVPNQSESRFEPLVLHDRPFPLGRARQEVNWLTLSNASRHNLKDVTVRIPLGRFVCVTGVSGSGKTTLVRELLLPVLNAELNSAAAESKASARFDSEENGSEDDSEEDAPASRVNEQPCVLKGAEHLVRAVLVDQSQLGKTPRSNPAVYVGAFDDIREFFAASEIAKQRGLNASAFSFNSAQGQCERCRGAGFEKIEMQFLSDVFIRCPDCNGRRYRSHILEVKVRSANPATGSASKNGNKPQSSQRRQPVAFSIADLLEATIDEAIDFLSGFPDSRPAQRALGSLRLLEEVGLGYLKLGQPINTLSGGESQRLKLVRELGLAQAAATASGAVETTSTSSPYREPVLPTLFLFDEPTTGLHFDDVRVLLKVFQRLVDAGHSVLVIEHNLDVIKSADWVIDLGPEAGDEGGSLVAEGAPERIAECNASHTGHALRGVLEKHEVAKPARRER
jgi:excinuclease ABC subunit A